MKLIKFLFFVFLLASFLHSQPIVINEIYNSSSTNEWLELLVLQDSLDLRNWDIRALVFNNQSIWSNLRKGTIIVVARSENSFSEDLDPDDYLLIVKSNNALYSSGNFAIIGPSEIISPGTLGIN